MYAGNRVAVLALWAPVILVRCYICLKALKEHLKRPYPINFSVDQLLEGLVQGYLLCDDFTFC